MPSTTLAAVSGSLQSGMRVRVTGKIGRGQEGTLRNFDGDHGRWSVVLDNGASYHLLSIDLEVLDADDASGPVQGGLRWSGDSGPIAAPDYSSLGKGTKPVEAHNGTLQSGSRVRVLGAIGRGQEGTLRNFDKDHRRWSVVLDGGASYHLRGDDLQQITVAVQA